MATSEARRTPRRALFATMVDRQRENSYVGFSFLSNCIPAYILENIFKTTLIKTSGRHPRYLSTSWPDVLVAGSGFFPSPSEEPSVCGFGDDSCCY